MARRSWHEKLAPKPLANGGMANGESGVGKAGGGGENMVSGLGGESNRRRRNIQCNNENETAKTSSTMKPKIWRRKQAAIVAVSLAYRLSA
jgi:hypothetical protein